jgi:hypothetical protein
MCASLPTFRPLVLDCLLSVMPEVDDSTPLVRTLSDGHLVVHARDCL